jgi:hypothetical protein
MALVNVCAVGIAVFFWSDILKYGDRTATMGWDARLEDRGWIVSSVSAAGPAAVALRVGDRIRAVNGDRGIGGAGMIGPIHRLAPGAPYWLTVSREGAEYTYRLAKSIAIEPRPFGGLAGYGSVALAFLVTGLTIWILRPDQLLSQLAYAACLFQALVTLRALTVRYEELAQGFARVVYVAGELLDGPHFVVACIFYSAVMTPGGRPFRFRGVIRVLAVYSVVALAGRAIWDGIVRIPPFETNGAALWWLLFLHNLFYVMAPLAVCAVAVLGFRRITDAQDRRRAGWILAGSLAGILPYAIVRLTGTALEFTGQDGFTQTSAYLTPLALATGFAVVIPFSAGYAVLKHRFLDIHIVVRESVQYALATRVLQILLALPVAALLLVPVSGANRTIAGVFLHQWGFIALLALLALTLRYREKLRQAVDRRFFRENYRQEQMLLSLADDVQNLESMPEIVANVGRRLFEALHPRLVQIFLRQEESGTFRNVYSLPQCRATGEVADTTPIIYALRRRRGAMSGTAVHQCLGPGGRQGPLEGSAIDLVIPFHGAPGTLVGFLVLGPRRSQQPYFASDRKLLEALAAQIAIVYENLSLRRQLDLQSKAVRDLRLQLAESDPGMVRECPACRRCFAAPVDRCPVDQTGLITTSLVPPVIADRYHLERVLGRGGNGTVFEAVDAVLRRCVAVKVQAPDKLRPEALRRFQREACALASLSHPNIVGAYDFGIAESGVAYFVMEFVRARTLRVCMGAGEIAPEKAAEWFAQLLDGIEAAHRAGIIHRDLKPENILIATAADTGNDLVKITDFGLARLDRPEAGNMEQLTIPGEVFGSVRYMAPEQLRGEPTSVASDLFAIGVMAVEVLTGRLPLGATYHERLASLSREVVIPLAAAPGKLRLRDVLMKCLSPEPRDRFFSAAALKAELIPAMTQYRHIAGRFSTGL